MPYKGKTVPKVLLFHLFPLYIGGNNETGQFVPVPKQETASFLNASQILAITALFHCFNYSGTGETGSHLSCSRVSQKMQCPGTGEKGATAWTFTW
jgi:hypothetical protein